MSPSNKPIQTTSKPNGGMSRASSKNLTPGAESDLSVGLIETFLLGMAMRRPFTTDETAFRAEFDAHAQLLINHLIAQGTEQSAP